MSILRVNKIAASGQTSENTGSVFFDGTGDYLSITDSTDFDFGSGDFTIEFFLYSASFSDYAGILGKRNAETDYAPLLIDTDNSAQKKMRFLTSTTGSSWISITSSSVFPLSQWVHVAVVRSGSTITLYENGVSKGSASISGSIISNSVPVFVGAGVLTISGSTRLNGFLSNLRIIKGKALYTSNFAPPTTELEVTPETVLVACHDGENIFAEKTGKIIAAYGDRSSGIHTVGESPIGITTFQPGLTRSVDVTAGPVLQGNLEYNSQNFLVLPKGTTTERFPNFAGAPASSARGLFGGGSQPFATKLNLIEYITISTTGAAQDFGDLTVARGSNPSSAASNTRGVWGGGASPSNDNTIDYVTIASTGNAKDFGDLTNAAFSGSGTSNATRGLLALGRISVQSNNIDYITISTLGNGFDFGDLTQSIDQMGSCASPTRGIFAGGLISPSPVSLTNVINYVNISSTGNAVDFGDLLQGGADGIRRCGGLSNATRGLFAGGESTPTGQKDIISFITMASLGDAQDFGDLSDGASQSDNGASSSVRGVFHLTSPANTTLHFLTINTLGNSNDFGDMTSSSTLNGLSNGHGGLG